MHFNYLIIPRLYHSKNSSCDFPEIPEEINMHLGSGLLHHRFGFRSVYDPNRRPPYVSTYYVYKHLGQNHFQVKIKTKSLLIII